MEFGPNGEFGRSLPVAPFLVSINPARLPNFKQQGQDDVLQSQQLNILVDRESSSLHKQSPIFSKFKRKKKSLPDGYHDGNKSWLEITVPCPMYTL